MMRLDKLLAECGFGSRNDIKKAVRSGLVTLNGETVRKADIHVDEEQDEITFDGFPAVYRKYAYFMLNKPAGYISATEGNVPVVMDLIMEPYKGMFPCGRLDKDTEGLLLITNDGPLAHRLLSPKNHVEKEYYVETQLPVREEDIEKFRKGIRIDGGITCQPAECALITGNTCRLIIYEGKFHEVKRMFQAVGNEVTYLKRMRMKNLVLDETLEPGEYRPLTDEELKDLTAAGS